LCKCGFFQLRLDFESFVITGPSTGSNTEAVDGKATGGVAGGTGQDINRASKCLTDIFTVTNPGGTSPPAICGINTAQHSKILFNIFLKISYFTFNYPHISSVC
jgi:hypothetical protein